MSWHWQRHLSLCDYQVSTLWHVYNPDWFLGVVFSHTGIYWSRELYVHLPSAVLVIHPVLAFCQLLSPFTLKIALIWRIIYVVTLHEGLHSLLASGQQNVATLCFQSIFPGLDASLSFTCSPTFPLLRNQDPTAAPLKSQGTLYISRT